MKLAVVSMLCLSMGASMVACGPTTDVTTNPPTTNPTTTNPSTTKPTTTPTTQPPVADKYTYRYTLSVGPTAWNPFTYETAGDAEILDYTQSGFYTFDYNEKKDGYRVICDMASDFPIDVTKQYVGKYGIKDGDTARVYEIPLRDNLEWEDGTKINAQSFVNSAKLLLDPQALNSRADDYMYSGNLVIHKAQDYLYGGTTRNVAADSSFFEDVYSEDIDNQLIFSWDIDSTNADYPSFISLMGFIDAGYDTTEMIVNYVAQNFVGDTTVFNMDVYNSMNGKTLAEIKANPAMKAAWDAIIAAWKTEPNEELDFFLRAYTYPEVDFSEVGLTVAQNGNLVIALDKELSGFYLNYALTGAWLVHEDTYKANSKVENGVFTSTYGHGVDTYKSYGPYKLSYFELDKEFRFTKNENWYGYDLPEYKGQYQTTDITCTIVKEASTSLEMFLTGKTDSYGLRAEDMADYQSSEHTYYTDGESVWYIAFNPDMEALKAQQEKAGANKNKTILTIKEFRQAIAYGLDRAAFCLATTPTSSAGKALFSDMIVSNPDTGEKYRSTEQAKDAILSFWGVADEVGPGKRYETKEEAIDAITGYDLAAAKNLFNVAYDKAIEQGLMDADDVVEICIGTPNLTSSAYNNGYDFLVNNYTEAVKGTKLEGKLTFTRDGTLGNGFGTALKTNQIDMLFFVGFSGSALNPYGLVEVYTTSNLKYDPSWNTSLAMLTVQNEKGEALTASLDDWTYALGGEVITAKNAAGEAVEVSAGTTADAGFRLNILAGIERAVLEQYDIIPLTTDSSATLKGMKIQYGTEDYVFGVGRGGIRYMTYNYSDSEWEKFVADQKGQLNYK